LYESPQNSFVAQFIGENNKLSGTVTQLDGKNCQMRLDDGTIITAEAVNIEGVGSRSTLSLRPERVELSPAESRENSVPGNVKEVLYLGDHLRIVMSVAGNDEFIVKVPNGGRSVTPVEGKQYTIGWSAADAKALDPVD
jgi:putative spermidine/putrescine transport system ATP-binding protein